MYAGAMVPPGGYVLRVTALPAHVAHVYCHGAAKSANHMPVPTTLQRLRLLYYVRQ